MGGIVKSVGGVASSLLGTNDKPEAQPAPAAMPALPDTDDETVRTEKRKKAAQIQARSGRLSTLLSDTGTSDKLGG